MEKIIIAAVADNGVIGCDNHLPWDIPEDRRLFRDVTLGHTVIMGRRTFESLGRQPLLQRHNIVVSRTLPPQPGIQVCCDFETAMSQRRFPSEKLFFIGGARIYQQALAVADTMIISRIHGAFAGDTFFPEYDASQWQLMKKSDYPEFQLQIYRRIKE